MYTMYRYMEFFKCQVTVIYCALVCTSIMLEMNVTLYKVSYGKFFFDRNKGSNSTGGYSSFHAHLRVLVMFSH